MNAELTRLSKFLSFVLRHRPEKIGLVLDDQGWTAVDNLIHQAKTHDEFFSAAQIHEIVKDNDKQRFQLSEDGAQIRVVQGHSTAAVTIKRQAQRPPAVLFHGTADRFQASIEKQGLLPGKRHQVHLSSDQVTARAVGQRHGWVIIFSVDAATLHERGHRFEQAENGVWLTDRVPAWALTRLS